MAWISLQLNLYGMPPAKPMPQSVKTQVLKAFAPEIRDQQAELEALLEQMQRYGKVVNLTGSLDEEALWREFAEALLAFRALQVLELSQCHWLDIGSGGGLPGLLFGVLLKRSAHARGVLIEPRKRRVDFLRLTIAQRKIQNLEVAQTTLGEAGRLAAKVSVEHPTWVSARAVFAPEQWLERAGKAWPAARCMVHGSVTNPQFRALEHREIWQDHCVEIWSPVNPAS